MRHRARVPRGRGITRAACRVVRVFRGEGIDPRVRRGSACGQRCTSRVQVLDACYPVRVVVGHALRHGLGSRGPLARRAAVGNEHRVIGLVVGHAARLENSLGDRIARRWRHVARRSSGCGRRTARPPLRCAAEGLRIHETTTQVIHHLRCCLRRVGVVDLGHAPLRVALHADHKHAVARGHRAHAAGALEPGAGHAARLGHDAVRFVVGHLLDVRARGSLARILRCERRLPESSTPVLPCGVAPRSWLATPCCARLWVWRRATSQTRSGSPRTKTSPSSCVMPPTTLRRFVPRWRDGSRQPSPPRGSPRRRRQANEARPPGDRRTERFGKNHGDRAVEAGPLERGGRVPESRRGRAGAVW